MYNSFEVIQLRSYFGINSWVLYGYDSTTSQRDIDVSWAFKNYLDLLLFWIDLK